MPVKNPILIYECVFRRALITFGIWEQILSNNICTKNTSLLQR